MPDIFETIDIDNLTSQAIRAYEQAAPLLEPAIAAREQVARRSGEAMTKAELADAITRQAVVPFTGKEDKAELVGKFTESMTAQVSQAKRLAGLQEAVRADRDMARRINSAIEAMKKAHVTFIKGATGSPWYLISGLTGSVNVSMAIEHGRIARQIVLGVANGTDIRRLTEREVKIALQTISYVPAKLESGLEEKLLQAAGARMFLRDVGLSYGVLENDPMTVDVALLGW